MDRHNLYRKYAVIIMMAISLIVSGCSRQAGENEAITTTTSTGDSYTAPPVRQVAQRDMALVRVIYTIPDKPADLYVQDQKVFTNIGYKTVTHYQEVSDTARELEFSLKPVGEFTALPLTERDEAISGGRHYSLIALPGSSLGDAAATLRVIDDKLTPPAAGKTKVRLIHATPAIKELDFYLVGKDEPLFNAVLYQTDTSYKELDPVTASVEVRHDDQPSAALSLPNVEFAADKLYTIVVFGGTEVSPGLEAIVIEDKFSGGAQSNTGGM